MIAHAASSALSSELTTLLGKLSTYIVNPLIELLFAIAFVMFLVGVYEFVRGAADPDARAKGGQHILWGVVGLAIMVSVYGIIRIIANTLGVSIPIL
jgi:hypothetical protein